ncbi:MAG: pseudaminic acid cytidylyltransferase [Proteobacteria bacterium]|nr:pseudaminic acid cytidylyltransferase [Pseudomonadota bacterium]
MKLAVIPARGGSKRIPRKNVRPFLGRPIIRYSIDAALQSGLFDRVVVSTDDEGIADTARALGADTPFMRPPQLADDFSGTNEVVRHAIEWFEASGESVDLACCIYATAPFISIEDLRAGYRALSASDAPFAFSVTTFPYPVQRALRRTETGKVCLFQPAHVATRSQDLETAWHDAAQFYWGRAFAFREGRNLFAGEAIGVPVARERVQDIDTEEDWERAEVLYRVLQERGRA